MRTLGRHGSRTRSIAERYGLSIYDAMIAAAAMEAGCDTLWSEDMQHGLVLEEGLRIVNPFRVAK
jgi:predicted nucleic acid-binding protein